MGLTPNSRANGVLRFGSRGSLSVNTSKNTFYDFESEEGGGLLDFVVHKGFAQNHSGAAEWAKQNGIITSEATVKRQVLRKHMYEDAKGRPIRKAIKFNDGTWSQQRFEAGEWRYGVRGVPSVPYGLPRLLEDYTDKILFIFEGEKDCELAWKHGLLATTNVGGAGKWTQELNQYLKGRKVCIVPDNDQAGIDHVHKVAASLSESSIENFILWSYLSNLPAKGDFSDWMQNNELNVDNFLKLLDQPQNEPKPEPEINEQPNEFIWKSVSALADKEPPERNWLVQDWIPGKQVTLLYGDGGTGKSQIAMQLCLAVAAGRSWFQLPTEQGRSLYLTAEDDEDELHRRFAYIARGMSFDLREFADCQYLSLAGEDALFAVQDSKNQILHPSPLFNAFSKQIEQHRPKVAVVDTLADINPTDENQRSAARQFIQLLRKPAIEFGCAVIALAHPSLTGLNSGSGTSGSTAWSNSVRSRLYFSKQNDESADPDLRVLQLMKSNYSQAGTTVNVKWQDGMFVHQSGGSQLDRNAAMQKAKRVFMHLLDQYNLQGRNVNASGGSSYAPRLFAADDGSEGITKTMFGRAMNSLFSDGQIVNESTKRATRIVRK